jgi:hypothetical protein
MEWRIRSCRLVAVLAIGMLLARPVFGQITTGTVVITGVNTTLQVRSLADPTPSNLTRDASGALINPTGFGAVTAVAPARQIQLMLRFHF